MPVKIEYSEDSPIDGVIKIGRLYLKFGFDDCDKELEDIQRAQLNRLFALISEPKAAYFITDGLLLRNPP